MPDYSCAPLSLATELEPKATPPSTVVLAFQPIVTASLAEDVITESAEPMTTLFAALDYGTVSADDSYIIYISRSRCCDRLHSLLTNITACTGYSIIDTNDGRPQCIISLVATTDCKSRTTTGRRFNGTHQSIL